MKREMPKLGQILYDKAVGNAARGLKEVKITDVEVVKVGRSLFTCREVGKKGKWAETVFQLDSRGWREKTQYCQDHELYESRQEILDKVERNKLHDEIQSEFRGYNASLSLASLRAISDIITKEKVANL